MKARREKRKNFCCQYKKSTYHSQNSYFQLFCADLGPYTMDFTSSGRHMTFGGRKGHLGIVDMKNMDLIKEIQVCT